MSMTRTLGSLGAAAALASRAVPPALATRIASTSAVLTRAFSAKRLGKLERQVGHERLPCWVHLVKQPRQKLCWQGACGGGVCVGGEGGGGGGRERERGRETEKRARGSRKRLKLKESRAERRCSPLLVTIIFLLLP